MYVAAILRQNAADLLKWIIRARLDLEKYDFQFETPKGDPLPHHMTICLGNFDPKLNDWNILSGHTELSISSIVVNHALGVCAAPVDSAKVKLTSPDSQIVTVKTINKNPHITACLKPEIPPKLSNVMLDGIPNSETIVHVLDQIYLLDSIIRIVD